MSNQNQSSTATMSATGDVAARLAQINAAVAARTQQPAGPNPAANAPDQSTKAAFVCPIDPAERAACDACQ
jgi:hypothetical protein